ncbi:MAG: IS66 family transposase [Desulfobacteraceae bacterium]|nr:IS66 family transposase [Desulfobacteraceae bacterium]
MTKEDAEKIYQAGQDVVVKTICDLSNIIDSLEKRIDKLEKQVAKLSKNSSNSGKRPSSDDITKRKKKARKGKKRRIGAQPGHKPHFRTPFSKDEIDNFVDYIFTECPICDGAVSLMDGPPRIIQQIEIPEQPIIKYEHSSYPVWCSNCETVHYMPFPEDVINEGLIKSRLTAMIAYKKHVCHASFSTIRKFVRDVLGEKISRGQLRKIIEKVSMSLEMPYMELLNLLPFEDKLNVDETGHKENRKKLWTWVFRADLFVLFKIDESRGSKVLIDVLGKEFNGVLGCDYFSAYQKYMKDFDVTVQFCIAHLIRDIRFLKSLPDEKTKAYGKKLLNEVKKMFKIIHERDENMSEKDFLKSLIKIKEKIIATALAAPSQQDKDGKETKREAQNMANRFRKHGKEYFEFITTPGVEPTNNLAEQAIRFIIIDRYVTQGTRSEKGRQSSERIWTVIATCALQGKSAFDFILKAVRAYFTGSPAPSLIPNTS